MQRVASVIRNVDLRSDTVTRPTAAMRKAMFEAEVGDDVYGEDPTVNLLQERMAKMFGKEKALFFPTGTMSNLAAVMSWCGSRGSEVILGDKSHIHVYEQAGISQLGGVGSHNLPNKPDGTMDINQIISAIRTPNIHFPTTDLISIENTHNVCGGRVLPLEYVNELGKVCRERKIPLHMDGARIWNAAVASGVSVKELVANVDSISACLSKGLGAPVGSVLIGSGEMIDRARRIRKALGGGMRQCGVIAAAGLQALDDFERGGVIEEDHRRAKMLAQALRKIPGIIMNPEGEGIIESNIVAVEVKRGDMDSSFVVEKLKDRGIFALAKGSRIRFVLHRNINDEDIDFTIKSLSEILMNK